MVKARLSSAEVGRICKILAGWEGKLSWALLIIRVEFLLGRTFTRQGLDKHALIKVAFQKTKTRVRQAADKSGAPNSRVSPELEFALRRIDNLKAEIGVLEAQRDVLLERFATWLYNARGRGLSEQDLSRPLPPIDRDPSERQRRS